MAAMIMTMRPCGRPGGDGDDNDDGEGDGENGVAFFYQNAAGNRCAATSVPPANYQSN